MKVSKVLATTSSVIGGFFLSSGVYAQKTATDWLSGITGSTTTDLPTWISGAINLAVGLAALVCVAILIGSGYMYITAAGDETKIEKATKSLTWAIVGLVICFIAVILVQFVLKNVIKAA